jgi:hypothetical protein
MKALLKRAYDACVTDASVTIFINKVNLHQEIPQLRRTHRKKDDNGDVKKAYQDFPDPERIQLGDHRNFMGHTRTGVVRQRVSTILGGKHVDYVLNQITKKASDLINKQGHNVKPQHVKDKLFLYSRVRSRTPSSTARRRFWTCR